MNSKQSFWRWVRSIAGASIVLSLVGLAVFTHTALTLAAAAKLPSYEQADAEPWDHKIKCRVAAVQVDPKDKDALQRVDEGQEMYFWIRGRKYFRAADASFMNSYWVAGRSPFPDFSYWRGIEAGHGKFLCLDHVSRANDKELPLPYCALSIDMNTLEYKTRADGQIFSPPREIGQCTVLSKGTP